MIQFTIGKSILLLLSVLLVNFTFFSCENPVQEHSSMEENVFSEQMVTVSFKDRKSIHSKQSVSPSSLLKVENPLTRDGYIFDGWYKDKKKKDPWIFQGDQADMVMSDITLYAKWMKEGQYWKNKFDVVENSDPVSFSIKASIKEEIREITVPAFYKGKGERAKSMAITMIGGEAFKGSANLISVSLPDSITSIGEEAFNKCFSLESISLPAVLVRIGDSAFQRCDSLTSINLPEGVTKIGDLAFADCSSLAKVIVNATEPPSLGSLVFDNCSSDLRIQVPSEVVEAYKIAPEWSDYADKIEAIPSQDLKL